MKNTNTKEKDEMAGTMAAAGSQGLMGRSIYKSLIEGANYD